MLAGQINVGSEILRMSFSSLGLLLREGITDFFYARKANNEEEKDPFDFTASSCIVRIYIRKNEIEGTFCLDRTKNIVRLFVTKSCVR